MTNIKGLDATDAIDRINEAAHKLYQKPFDEAGIVIRANDLYTEYARKHGLVASTITAIQKQAAFLDGILKRKEEMK